MSVGTGAPVAAEDPAGAPVAAAAAFVPPSLGTLPDVPPPLPQAASSTAATSAIRAWGIGRRFRPLICER